MVFGWCFFLTLLDLKFGNAQVANSPTEANCIDNNTSTVCALNASVGNLFGTDMINGQYIQFTPNIDADSSTYPYTITHYSNTNTVISSTNVKINQMDSNYMIVEKSGGAKELISHKAAISNPATVNVTLDPDGITQAEINERITGSTTAPLDKTVVSITSFTLNRFQVADVQWNVSSCTSSGNCIIISKVPGMFCIADGGCRILTATQYIKFSFDDTNPTYKLKTMLYDGNTLIAQDNQKILRMTSDYILITNSANNGELFNFKNNMDSSGITLSGSPIVNLTEEMLEEFSTSVGYNQI